jgi:hypothetical protein
MGADCLVNITRGMSFSRCFSAHDRCGGFLLLAGGNLVMAETTSPTPHRLFLEPLASFVVLLLGLASDNALDCASSARYERPCPLRSKAVGRRHCPMIDGHKLCRGSFGR